MASGWLIRRFIDRQAQFGFAADRESVPDHGVPFDMFGPVLQSMLINLPATDPVTFVGVSALLIAAIALVACSVPARRATRINPIATLRAE